MTELTRKCTEGREVRGRPKSRWTVEVKELVEKSKRKASSYSK